MKKFTMLISVYKHEKAEHIKDCFDSIAKQTLQPTEIILVEDGPIPVELHQIIEQECKRFPNIRKVVLEKNQGLGIALNKGMQFCSYDIIARMDTDDICMPQRFELQMKFLQEHPEVDVLSSWITEFYDVPENTIAIRDLPEMHNEIYSFGKRRNPINHPAVMFRKKAVIDAGGYKPFPLFEDYYLWARMLMQGYKFHNLQQSLLLFRRSSEMIQRRGGFSYAHNEINFQRKLHEIGYITYYELIRNICQRYGIRIAPNWLRSLIYKYLLRKSLQTNG